MMIFLLWCAAAYISGSFPSSYVITRAVKGVDIREHGSGNPGATNVFRVAGTIPGIATFFFDILKGFVPVILAAGYYGGDRSSFLIAVGLCAIAGHMWTVFLKFRGGKGVATSAGVFLALMPLPTLFAIGLFAAALYLTRYVSLGSMLAALSLPLFTVLYNKQDGLVVFAWIIAAVVIFKHRANIKRLLTGTENKFGRSTTLKTPGREEGK